jgi:acetyl-CoA synthetase
MDNQDLGRAVPVWYPTPEYIRGSHLENVMQAMGIKLDAADPETAYGAFYRRSIAEPEAFWRATLDEIGVEWFEPFTRVVDLSNGLQWPHWFPDGKLNLVHNALFRHLKTSRGGQHAIIWEGEDGAVVRLSYAELGREVGRAANALRKLGISQGDRVALFLPMLPETAIAALAIAYIGAILVPIFSGYGAEAAAVRLRDSNAKLLITADAFYRRGQVVRIAEYARQAADIAGCVDTIIAVRRMNRDFRANGIVNWDEAIQGSPQPRRKYAESVGIPASGWTASSSALCEYRSRHLSDRRNRVTSELARDNRTSQTRTHLASPSGCRIAHH